MFRQKETFYTDWREKTVDAMHQRRFRQAVSQLPPLGAERLSGLSYSALRRRLDRCWQDVPRKPLRAQQASQAIEAVIGSIQKQADCLSPDEHDLVERALILGGCAQIEDVAELEAAKALALRLWANVGLVSGKPYVELEPAVAEPAAKAFVQEEHEAVRDRFRLFHSHLNSALYCVGALDDRYPQQMILRDVLGVCEADETSRQLARRYLWASYDCFDYCGGVMLVHTALAEPQRLALDVRRKTGIWLMRDISGCTGDILPEEIPLEDNLERVIAGAMRTGVSGRDVARTIRFLCKQGAPLGAMERVLQSSLIVQVTGAMRSALTDMYYTMPKWIECGERGSLQ